MEVRNRFKGLDLIGRVPVELWMEVCDILWERGIKTIPKKKKYKKAKWLSEETLQIAVKRREVKSKGEKERWFWGSKIIVDCNCNHEIKTLTPWKESFDQPRQHIKKQRHYFVNKGLSSQGHGFSSGHVWMWELDSKESWAPKNWCFWTVVLEKTLKSSLDYKEIQPVFPK